MSAVSNIVLNDAQATPVAHTFIPLGQDKNGVWWWEDQTGTSPLGYNRISLQLVRNSRSTPGLNAGVTTSRIKVSIQTPKMETIANNSAGITPPPTIAFTPRCTMEFIISDRASLQDRKDLRKYADFLCAEAQLTDMIENLRNVY